jgi:hypothetical protein
LEEGKIRRRSKMHIVAQLLELLSWEEVKRISGDLISQENETKKVKADTDTKTTNVSYHFHHKWKIL